MQTINLLDNKPRRRRKHARRKHHTKRTGKLTVARSVLSPKYGGQAMKSNKKHGRRRRYRHNPFSVKKLTGNLGGTLKAGALGALAIAANKAISGQANKLLGFAASDTTKPLVELASAVFLVPLLARLTKMRGMEAAASAAAAVTIFEVGRSYMPASVKAALAGYEFPAELTPASDTVQLAGDGDGYLPIPTVSF